MTTVADVHCGVFPKNRAGVAEIGGNSCKRHEHIERRDRFGRFLYANALRGDMLPKLHEQFVFEIPQPFFGAKHLGFHVLEFGCDEPLSVDKRLLSYVVVGDRLNIRF